MPSLEQYHIDLQTPVGTTRFQVTHVDRIPSGNVLLTLVDGQNGIDHNEIYPATFATSTWDMQGEFRVQDHLENGDRSVIIGMFRQRQS